VLHLASQCATGTQITVNFYGYQNPNSAARLLGSKTLLKPVTANMVPTAFLVHWFQDEIIVNGPNMPARISARTINCNRINSRSTERRVTE
jgi:hypothetical protein